MNEFQESCYRKLVSDIWYPVRRYYIDLFYHTQISRLAAGSTILDMGGKKKNKRGRFDIESFDHEVKYANLSSETAPDYLCDVAQLPIDDHSFDVVILAEVLEHVPDPEVVLHEAFRVLKRGGLFLMSTPFMIPIHLEPSDYRRFTDQYFMEVLARTGFSEIVVEKQGLFFSVMAHMLKGWAYQLSQKGGRRGTAKRWLLNRLAFWSVKKGFALERQSYYREHKLFAGYTTGFAVVCSK